MKNLLNLFAVIIASFAHSQITSSNVLQYVNQMQTPAGSASISSNTIIQVGNENLIEVKDFTANYLALSQIGDVNTTYYSNYTNYPTNAEIHVQGSGNYIEIQGNNSISDGMKININANDTSFLMRNH